MRRRRRWPRRGVKIRQGTQVAFAVHCCKNERNCKRPVRPSSKVEGFQCFKSVTVDQSSARRDLVESTDNKVKVRENTGTCGDNSGRLWPKAIELVCIDITALILYSEKLNVQAASSSSSGLSGGFGAKAAPAPRMPNENREKAELRTGKMAFPS